MPQCSARPRPVSPEHAAAVRVVDHQPGAVALLELDDAGQIRDVAFGGVEALDDDERVFVLGALLAQDLLQRLEIVVLGR